MPHNASLRSGRACLCHLTSLCHFTPLCHLTPLPFVLAEPTSAISPSTILVLAEPASAISPFVDSLQASLEVQP
jgi:hypothetical protein